MEFTEEEFRIVYDALDYYVSQMTNDMTENLGLMKKDIELLELMKSEL